MIQIGDAFVIGGSFGAILHVDRSRGVALCQLQNRAVLVLTTTAAAYHVRHLKSLSYEVAL